MSDQLATGALQLAGFTDLHAVASGGDSTIYRGTQTALDRDVAIKVVNLSAEDEVRRFQREIALTVKLGRAHPNIVTVLDTRTLDDGRPCIVMDFFELGSTHDRLRSTGPFLADDVISMGRVIADALGFAHDQRVVHRDVKPQNILILPTSYVLADFGIARSVDAGHTASLDRLSYRHASPEVLDGRPPEPVDDLWSLCSTMVTLLEGRAPFASDDPSDDTALAYLRRVRTGQSRPLPPHVPTGLRAIIERGMHPDRSHRFSHASELIAGLQDLERHTTDWAPGAGAGTPVAPPVPLVGGPPAAPGTDGLLPTPDDRPQPVGGGERDAGSTAPRPGRGRGQVAAADTASPGPADSVEPPEEAIGDLPAGSDDLLWAPGSAVSTSTTTTAATADPAPSRGAAGPAVTPRPADRPDLDPSPAADRDRDTRISAGHSRPLAAEPGSPAVSVAAHLAADDPADADAGPSDAAPTGWRPPTTSTSTAADAAQEDDGPPSTKVRAGIIVLAAVMLLVSGTVAYFLTRPSTRTVTPITDSVVNVGAGSSILASGGPVQQNDPDYTPQVLSVKFEGDALMRVTVRGPQAEDASLVLFDATAFDPDRNPQGLKALIQQPVARAKEGDTVITAAVSFARCSTVNLAVVATNAAARRAGVSYFPVQSPGCAESTGRGASTSRPSASAPASASASASASGGSTGRPTR